MVCEIIVYLLWKYFRVWFTFKVFGHKGDVSLLDGGLTKWKLLNYPLESGPPKPEKRDQPYKANFQEQFIVKLDDILSNLNSNKAYVVGMCNVI